MEDTSDPVRTSSYYDRHFNYFKIQTSNKTIKQLVTELKLKVRENFVRYCHYQPENFSFSSFRHTRTYRLHRELQNYLLRLSSWLYRGKNFPPSLRKTFSRINSFQNPYLDFSLVDINMNDLSSLNNLMLTVAYNKNICGGYDDNLKKEILQEFRARNIDTSEVEDTEDVLIEICTENGQPRLCCLKREPV
ncbi:hypothetical protein GCM10010465_24760 [Actinomadura fibrosa]